MSGYSIPVAESVTLQAFLPKGESSADAREGDCDREASSVRVLGLRNTSIKLLTATMNIAIRKPLDRFVPRDQRGFMKGRNFCQNILEVDALVRVHSARPEADDRCPMLYALDYGHAFPSLSQEFVILVLRKMGCPIGFLMFVETLYDSIEGVMSVQGIL
eukprot:2257674-Pyramimonas_sp.AAC.1